MVIDTGDDTTDGSSATASAEITRLQEQVLAQQKTARDNWQSNQLPFIKWCLTGMALLIFAAGAYAFLNAIPLTRSSSDSIKQYSQIQISTLSAEGDAYSNDRAVNATVAYRTARRYDLAAASLVLGGWLRFATFMMGSALIFTGALFVIGKFAETSPITVSGETSTFKASLTTASPGLAAIAIGAVIIVTAATIRHPVEVNDETLSASSGKTGEQQSNSGVSDEDLAKLCPKKGGLNPEADGCDEWREKNEQT